MTTVKTTKYARRTFYVEAVRVPFMEDERLNLETLAEWCGGKIQQTDVRGDGLERYIFVHVHTPMNERQKMAFPGDWILKTEKGFKVYTEQAFERMFEEVRNESREATDAS